MCLVLTRGFHSLDLLVTGCLILVSGATATCYFPDYIQGEYVMQTSIALQSHVRYTEVSVSLEAISTWGYCQKRIGNDLYLIESLSNSSYCIRCFHISTKSPNILVVRTAGNPERCFVSVPAAENSCPKVEYMDVTKQMVLYKISKDIKKQNCPINGRYMIRYRQYKADHLVECASRTSDISNCPVGSDLKIHFQDCPFENHDLTFECLGTWNGPSRQQYLALFDTRATDEDRPPYRCGLYQEDLGSNVVYVAFSSDSTCLTDLKSSQSGFETLVLTPYPNSQLQTSKCRFPSRIEGRWESVTIQNDVFTYMDSAVFATYTFHCLNYDDFPSTEDKYKILVHGRTQCGDELYTCMWVNIRGSNVFEFQLAQTSSSNYNASLCSPSNFQPDLWIPQARRDYTQISPCPIIGEYFGTIPNAEGLCAKLSSDCASPDVMYYTVSDCSQQIYEDKRSDRRYRQVDITSDIVQQTDSSALSTPVTETSDPSPKVSEMQTTSSSSVNKSKINSSIVESSESSSSTTVFSSTIRQNDSLAVESNEAEASMGNLELNNVRSYFVENRRLPAFIYEDARFEVPAKTFLPPPISSSTLPSAYRRVSSAYYNLRESLQPNFTTLPVYERKQPYSAYPPPQFNAGSEYYHSNERLHSTYYHEWNGSRPADAYDAQIRSGEPTNFNRRTVIALPPIQLPPVAPRVSLSSSRRPWRLFKDREYRCLGQWQENGLTYTFTERRHVGTFECFVGQPISQTEFMIREAGRYCVRSAASPLSGMILTKKSNCPENRTSLYQPGVQTVPVTMTASRPTTRHIPQYTTKPWRPITNVTRPQSSFRSKTAKNSNNATVNVPFQFLILLFLICSCSFRK